jgi:hypothetical protein
LGVARAAEPSDAVLQASNNTTVTPERDYEHDLRTATASLSYSSIVDLVSYQQGVRDSIRDSFNEIQTIINSWGNGVPHLITKVNK